MPLPRCEHCFCSGVGCCLCNKTRAQVDADERLWASSPTPGVRYVATPLTFTQLSTTDWLDYLSPSLKRPKVTIDEDDGSFENVD